MHKIDMAKILDDLQAKSEGKATGITDNLRGGGDIAAIMRDLIAKDQAKEKAAADAAAAANSGLSVDDRPDDTVTLS